MRKSRGLMIAALLLMVAASLGVRGPLAPSGGVLVMELGGDIPEYTTESVFTRLLGEEKPLMIDKVECLTAAARDPEVRAVVARITDADYGFAKAQELRDAILAFRKSGKPIAAYLELEGGGNIEYYVASACDKIYLSPASTLGLIGLSSRHYYLGGVWDKLYLDLQVDQIKEYKSFADMIARKEMSPAEREMDNAILDSTYDQLTRGIAEGRGVSQDTVKGWIDAAWLTSDQYVAAKTVDGLKYLDEAVDETGGKDHETMIEESDYFQRPTGKVHQSGKGINVALVFGVGNIMSGQEGQTFGASAEIASEAMVKRLRKALEDDTVRAVIFRIDSGGGSALASDVIWRATQQVKAGKPIVVSMSDVAGSGGYYIACGASAIVAQPGTITGSIGILTVRPSLAKLLKKAGIGAETLTRGKFADLNSMDHPLDEAGLARTHDSIAALYDLFTRRVGAGRAMSPERVNEIGRGRVYTGAQAKELGLVDRLGGFDAAEAEVRRLLNEPEDKEINLIYKREKVTLWKMLTGKAEERLLNELLSPGERELMSALRQDRIWKPGQPLALMPEVVKLH
jgi:protease IV